MIDHINATQARHIVTIEDPIEVLHTDKRSIVNQREVGDRHRRLPRRAQAGAAAGPRRHPHRRDARPRDGVGRARPPPRPATSCSRRCTPWARPRRSTASSTSSRPTSSSRCACRSPARSRGSSPSGSWSAATARAACPRWRCSSRPAGSSTRSPTADADPRARGDHRRRRVLRDADVRPEPAAPLLDGRGRPARTRLAASTNPHDLRLKIEQADMLRQHEAEAGQAVRPHRLTARAAQPTSGPAPHRRRRATMTAVSVPAATRAAPRARLARSQQVARALADGGHECYLVGGSVRDALLDRAARSTSTSPPTPGPTRSSGSLAAGPTTSGSRASASAPSAAQEGGVPCEITTFRAEVYRPESRKPEVAFADDIETDLSRRDFTVNAMALRLPDAGARRPVRRGGRPRGAAAAHAARARGLVQRRPAAHAARGPLRRRGSASSPTPSSWPRSRRCAEPARDRRARSASATSSRSCCSSTTRRPGSGSSRDTGLSDEFLPELNAMRLEQDPIHHHKDVLAHTIAVVRKTSPELRAAARRAVPRRRQAEDALVRARACDVPPPRGGRRAHDGGAAAPRCGTRTTSSTTSRSSSTCTCASTPTRWAGPTTRCAATCATPGTCSRRSTTCSAATARRATSARRGRSSRRMDELEARIAELPRAGGAAVDPAAARRPPGDGLPRRGAGPRRGRGARRSCSRPASTRARSTRTTPTPASAPGTTPEPRRLAPTEDQESWVRAVRGGERTSGRLGV